MRGPFPVIDEKPIAEDETANAKVWQFSFIYEAEPLLIW